MQRKRRWALQQRMAAEGARVAADAARDAGAAGGLASFGDAWVEPGLVSHLPESYQHKRKMWRHVPCQVREIFLAPVRRCCVAFAGAFARHDQAAMSQALQHFMSIPRTCLAQPRGQSQAAIRALGRQIEKTAQAVGCHSSSLALSWSSSLSLPVASASSSSSSSSSCASEALDSAQRRRRRRR